MLKIFFAPSFLREIKSFFVCMFHTQAIVLLKEFIFILLLSVRCEVLHLLRNGHAFSYGIAYSTAITLIFGEEER